jgi:Mrp family chromosome partitioning ATPase
MLRQQLRGAGDPRLLTVASPREGDEAAICATELALAYEAIDREQVLLLEFDTRRPRVAALLGLRIAHCFARQMVDNYDGSPEPWRAISVFRAGLHVLAVDPTRAAECRLSAPVVQQALGDLTRRAYGRIIAVGPRVLDSAEIGLVEGLVDGVLLTGTAGRTTVGQLRRAAQQLGSTRILGVTLLESD